MQRKKIRAWLLPLLLTVLSVLVIGASLSLRFLDLDTYKGEIVAQVKSALNRDLLYQSGEFSFRYGPAFTFSGVTVKEKDGASDFIRADRLTIRIAILPLLRRQLVLSRMQLERPFVELSRDRSGQLNISDLLSRPKGGTSATIGGVELDRARVRFTDLAVGEAPVVTELTDLDLYLSRLTRGKSCDFKLSGSLISGSRKVPLFLAGVAKLPAEGASWKSCELSGRVRTGPIDALHFFPYYGRYLPFKSLGGGFALEGHFKGRPDSFRSKVELAVSSLYLDYPQVFHAKLTPRTVRGSCEIDLTPRDLEFRGVKLDVDGLEVQGSCRLSDLRSGDMRITAHATTNRFNLRDFKQYVPYGVIVKDTADFIEQKIPWTGFYRLEEGRLDGRVSQILHMERGQNYNVLYVRAHVEDGVVAYGGGFPVVSGVTGELFLAGKDFILKGITGRFGSSPITALEGRITDYPLLTPCRYLFSAQVLPRQPEAAWVLGKGKGEKLSLSDGATLKVSGQGTTSLYNLSGEGDLSQASYSFPELLTKPKGRPNTLSFRVSFSKDNYRINAMDYRLAPLALSLSATSHYDDGPVSLQLRTNQFQSSEVAPFLPSLAGYHPSGRVQAQLQGNGAGLDRLSWNGTVLLSGVSITPGESVKPLSGINGSLKINGDTVESSQISARIGSSSISGHGTLTGFRAPTVTVFFSSPLLDLADLGFRQAPGKRALRAQNVEGTISYNKQRDYLQLTDISGTVGRSTLQVKGVVQELQHPRIELSVTSPHLETDDLAPLFASPGGGSRPTAKIHLFASEGWAGEIPFQRLRTVVMLEDNILYLQPLEMGCFQGDVTAKVRVDLGQGAPRYQVNCSMQRVSAERMARALGMKRQEVSGTLSLHGDLSAKGESAPELRKTALGAVKLKIEHGSVRRFSTLSKIFSILNFSQLFRGHLPDMVSGGMPYNRMTGDFAFRDGVASTQNFFLDSNAIKFSAVGKLDLVRDELDLNIGVQPLQTVDKVVSRIPIVGWILTGEDHSLITTYFEAKGKVEDPQVRAVPVKSLGKGVLNIFKRVFELPARLITDTGEVLIGN